MAHRACRVVVKVLGVRGVGSSSPWLQLQVEDSYYRITDVSTKARPSESQNESPQPRKLLTLKSFRRTHTNSEKSNGLSSQPEQPSSSESTGAWGYDSKTDTHTINQSHCFDVKDEKPAELTVAVVAKASMGMRKLVGTTRPIMVQQLLERNDATLQEPEWVDLIAKEGKKTTGAQVLIHATAAHAPPEQTISIFVGTWNVGNKAPPDDLGPWLGDAQSAGHNLVAIGSQECDYPPRPGFAHCQDDWVACIAGHFGPKYRLVKATSRGQMRLLVLVREDDLRAVTDVDSASEATGIAHVLANKGAVCISLKFWDTSFCFVNCHLAAHENFCEVRNSHYKEIARNMRPGIPTMDLLNQFHHVFWFGDLNYRLAFQRSTKHSGQAKDAAGATAAEEDEDAADDEEELTGTDSEGHVPLDPTTTMVLERIQKGEYAPLLEKDELHREMGEKRAFFQFQEQTIAFPPTFKMLKRELQEYSRKRLPAWCDRVLWRSLPGFSARPISYNSAPTIITSDHKPVAAVFTTPTYALPVRVPEDHTYAGFHSGAPGDDMRWHVQFEQLRASNLRAADSNGLSDPYIQFVGPNLVKPAGTRRKNKTLSPVWSKEEVPALVLQHKPLRRIEQEFVLVSIFDYDFSNFDDPLGYAVIPLAAAAKAASEGGSAKASNFQVDITHMGLPAGLLEGSMRLTWEPSSIPEQRCANM